MAFLTQRSLPPLLRSAVKTQENIQGVDMGIPLNLISNLFTHLSKELFPEPLGPHITTHLPGKNEALMFCSAV